MAMSTMLPSNLSSAHYNPIVKRYPLISAHQKIALDVPKSKKSSSKRPIRLAESLSHLLHLNIDTPQRSSELHFTKWKSILEEKTSVPTMSPKENISHKWHELHGSNDWEDLLDPLHPWLRHEIIKYGEFSQATYDAFDFDSFSEYCGSCRYNRNKLFKELGLTKHGYNVTKYVYGMSHIDVPQWLERSHVVSDAWSKDSNWMGFVAVSDEEESKRLGRRDITVAWRGTVAPYEWYEDFQRKLKPIGIGDSKVEHGFLSIYTSKSDETRYNKNSASEQVMEEVKRLVKYYKEEKAEEVSLTITGHSLGGALALLNAYEAAQTIPDIPVNVISFGAPRVGNISFRDELEQLGVKTLRVVAKQDLVPRMPGIVFNESLQMFDDITGTLEWVYTHVGTELKLDIHASPFLKGCNFNLTGIHSLETYLHLVDGFVGSSSVQSFRADAKRDVALVNKACDMLVDQLRIPTCWYQQANKGLVRNSNGRWVKPKREPEDIPSPTAVEGVNSGYRLSKSTESQRYSNQEVRQLCTV